MKTSEFWIEMLNVWMTEVEKVNKDPSFTLTQDKNQEEEGEEGVKCIQQTSGWKQAKGSPFVCV